MNVPELEHIRAMKVKVSETNEEETVYCIEYLNQPSYKSIRNSIIAQIGSCERLLIKTNGTYERNAIEREILILKLIVDLLEY